MPVFSFLMPRTGGGAAGSKPCTIRSTAAAAFRPSTDTEGGEKDDGPFFDLELPLLLPRDRSPSTAPSESDSDEDSSELRPAAAAASERTSDGLFFKGGLFSLDRASSSRSSSEPAGSKASLHFPYSLLRSATRLRSFKLVASHKDPIANYNKLENAPLASLFIRDNGPRSSGSWKSARLLEAKRSPSPEEKAATHKAIQKYLSKIRPLYVRAFARRGAHQVGPSEDEPVQVEARRLRKSRSASSSMPPPPPRRRDDTLLEKQDGIQSAIAHCKRSLNNRGSELPLEEQ